MKTPLKAGDAVLFSPPPSAYSRNSLQNKVSGLVGTVVDWCLGVSSYALVWFPNMVRPTLVNADYLEKRA